MFHRCSSVRAGAYAGIAVPATPTEIFRNINDGVTEPITAALPIAGGGGVSFAPAGPSPIARGPWHEAQFAAYSLAPSETSSGLPGRASAASLPKAAAKRVLSESTSEG